MKGWTMAPAALILGFASVAAAQGVPFNKAGAVKLSVPANPIAAGHLRVLLTVDLSGVTGQGPSGATAAALGAYVVPVRFDKSVLSFAQVTAGTAAGYSVTARATPKSAASAVGEVVVAASAEGGALATGSLLVAELTFYIRRAGLSTGLEVVQHGTVASLSLASAYVPGPPAKGPAALAGDVTGSGVQVQIPVGSVLSARPALPQGLVLLLVVGSCLLVLVRRRGRRVHLGLGLMLAWGIAVLGFGELARAAAPLIGDIDDDGAAGAADIVDLQDYLVGNAQAVAGKQTGRGDIDGNGMIDALDLALLRAGIEQGVSIRPAVELLVSPSPAKVGEAVTLSWTSTRATSAQISGVGGSRPAAGSVQVTPASLPAAYTITVTGTGGTGQATASIGKLSTFAMTAVPASVEIPRDSFAFYVVKLSSADGFTGMAELTAEGLPAGVTASFEPAHVAPGSAADLKLKVSAAAAVANTSFTVRAKGSSAGVSLERTASVQVKVLGAGTYSSGRVLTSDAVPVPVPGAVLSLVDQPLVTAISDAAGNYLLKNVPAGDHVLKIDCRPAAGALGSTLTFVHKAISATANAPNPMPMSFFMPRIDTDNGIDIPGGIVTEDTLFTSAAVPGLEVLLREGTVLTDPEGAPVTRLSITRLDVDRFPGQLMGTDADSIYTLQPEDTRLSIPVEVTYPNLNVARIPAGTQTDLYVLELSQGMFVKFGTGTVSADGAQVVPDPDPARPGFRFGMDHFSWHFKNSPAESDPPVCGDCEEGAQPVELSRGVEMHEVVDLAVSSSLGQASIERTYRSLSAEQGPWGTGWSSNFDIELVGPSGQSLQTAQQLTLRLPGNRSRVFSSQGGGVFVNTTHPGAIGDQIVGDLRITPVELRMQSGEVWGFAGFTGPVQSRGRLLYQRAPNGNTTTITRDQNGFPVRITEPGGRFVKLLWSSGRLQSVSDALGRQVTYSYDGNGRLSRVKDAADAEWTYAWDGQGRLQSLTDPLGNLIMENSYDAAGRVSSQKRADGGTFTYTYTLSNPGLQTSTVISTTVTDPEGNRRTHRFRGAFSVEVIDAQGGRTVSERDPVTNQVTSVIDPLGRVTRQEYDPQRGLVTASVDPAGGRTTFSYHATFSWITRITDPLNHSVTLDYDSAGNVTRMTDARGKIWLYVYDSRGLLILATDPLGEAVTFTYSPGGDLRTAANQTGDSLRLSYDAAGRLTRLRNARQQVYEYTYDGVGRLTARVFPDGTREELVFDGSGNLIAWKDGGGHTWNAQYDLQNRVSSVTDPLGRMQTHSYDKNDRVISSTDPRGFTTSLTYDALDLLTRVDHPDGTSTSFIRDAAHRLVRAEDSVTGAIELQYDVLDDIVAETTPEGVVRRTYDAVRRRTGMTVNGLFPVSYSYDESNRLISLAQGTLTFDFAHDDSDRLIRIDRSNGVTTTYSYNTANRILQILHRKAASILAQIDYTHDSNGRRATVASSVGSLSPELLDATHDAANQLTQASGQPIGHDLAGNMRSIDGMSYTFDARGRLVGIEGPGKRLRFGYDAFGRRVSKSFNGKTTRYLYDNANVAVEIGPNDAPTTLLSALGTDSWLASIRPGQTTTFLQDALGTVIGEADESGNLQTQVLYDPFGRTETMGMPSTRTLRFTGRELDESGLYYLRNRYYHPRLARFVSRDPIGIRSSMNFYAYVGNDPVNLTDRWGLAPELWLGGIENESYYHSIWKDYKSPAGEFTVVGHGNYSGAYENHDYEHHPGFLSVDDLAKQIIDKGYKPGMRIRLVACHTGGAEYAKQLADALALATGKPAIVIAPDTGVHPHGVVNDIAKDVSLYDPVYEDALKIFGTVFPNPVGRQQKGNWIPFVSR